MKHIPNLAAALLALAFLAFGINHFIPFLPAPAPSSSPHATPFFKSIILSSFMDFIKVIEIIGAILVATPKTRNWGLLALGPIIIGIIATNIFIKGDGAVFAPPIILISVLSAYLLWNAREKFLNLLNN